MVEFIDILLRFGHKAPVNGCGIRFPLLYPEERPFAITKSPQIGMTVFALVRHEEFDVKWLQRCFIEGERTFDVADSQNKVIEHMRLVCKVLQVPSPPKTRLYRGFPPGVPGPESTQLMEDQDILLNQ